jgi:CheY-specific phosphatase CheX
MDVSHIDSKVMLEIINGFVRSISTSLETMAFTKAKRVGIYVRQPKVNEMRGDITSLISLFGDLSGTCAISFPRKLDIKLIAKMMMDDGIDEVNDDVLDGIGEIANLTAGGAKGELSKVLGTTASISTPAIITGVGHTIEHKAGLPCIGCIFEAEGERFYLEIAVYLDDKD